jgi:phage-related protein
MAKSQTEQQKEYNSLLALTQSMLGKITDAMEETERSADKRNKKLQEQISLTREVLKQVQTEGDLVSAVNLIRGNNINLTQQDFGVNQRLLSTFLAQSQAVEGILQKHRDASKILQKMSDRVDGVKSKFNDVIDTISDGLGGIPLIGKSLENSFQPMADKTKRMFNVVGEKFKQGFGKSFMDTMAKGTDGVNNMGAALKSGITGGLSSAMKMASRFAGMLGPIGIAILSMAAGLALGFKRFKELDSAAKSFREQTGLLVSQTRGMQENIRAVNVEFSNLGVGVEDVAHAAAEFVNEFGGIEQPSKEVLGSMVMLNKNFGVGINEAAKLNKVFQNIGDLTAEQSQALIGQTTEMAKMAGVAPSKVIQDMANSSEYAYKYFQGSPKELAKAAVEAAKLGTSIEEAGKAADNLLDFQNSISSELEAQAMLGVNLNFGQARYLAANGDILGSQQAILDQIQKNVDLTNLNVYEQQALAKAAGMPIESIKNQIRLRERFGPLAKEELAAATALMDAGKDLNKITKEDLALQSQRMKSQQDMQSTMDAIQNEAGALKTGFMDMLAPLAGFVMNNLLDGLKMVGMILNPIMKGIGAIARVVFGIFGAIFDVITAIVSPIVAIGGAIIDMLVTPFQALASNLQPLFDKFKELKEVTMKAVQPILDVFRSLGNMFGEMVGSGPIGMFIDFLTWGLGKIVSLIGFIAKGIGFVLKPIMVLISGLMQGISFIGKMINDYIIQPALAAGQMVGNVLSTLTFGLVSGSEEISTPQATQEIPMMAEGGIVQSPIQAVVGEAGPEAIIPLDQLSNIIASTTGGQGGGRPSWVDEVVAAIRENKDVYMDRIKVSSTVTDTQERSGRQNRFGLQGA